MKARKASASKGSRREKQGQAPRPRIRQRRLMRNLLAGKNFTEAAVQAGYSSETVDKRGTKLLRAEHWAGLLREAKLDDPTLAQRLHDLVHAKSTKFFSDKGKVKDRRVVIDWDARAKGLDMAARIRGAYTRPNEEEDPKGDGPVVAIQLLVVDSLRHQKVGQGVADGHGGAGGVEGISFRVARPGEEPSPSRPPRADGADGGPGGPGRRAGLASVLRSIGISGPRDHRCADHLVQENQRGQLVQVCGLCGMPA